MARPRNDELKGRILDAACDQFSKQGYDATSYSSIAAACGISRNLVQYHFPKKEALAIAYMERVLDRAMRSLGLDEEQVSGDAEAIAAVGTAFFEELLGSPGTRAFLLDVISSRALTEGVLTFNTEWSINHFDVPEGCDVARLRHVVILKMGGFYELLYHCLKSGEPMDVAAELRSVVGAFAQAANPATD